VVQALSHWYAAYVGRVHDTIQRDHSQN
jgi:hypothetical protein